LGLPTLTRAIAINPPITGTIRDRRGWAGRPRPYDWT